MSDMFRMMPDQISGARLRGLLPYCLQSKWAISLDAQTRMHRRRAPPQDEALFDQLPKRRAIRFNRGFLVSMKLG